MVFSSEIFLFFFLPAVLIGYFAFMRTIPAKNAFLCLASLLFYAWGEPHVVFVMLGSIVANWLFALRIAKSRSRVLVSLAVCFNIALLVAFKYIPFLTRNINALFSANLPVPDIKLPIGISFFTFQALSYVLDVYRGSVPAQKSIVKMGLYISLFPQLVAGPIVRYSDIARQIDSRTVALDDLVAGVRRFVAGLAKKVLLADRLAELADFYFDAPGADFASLPVMGLWIGAAAYSFQIFFDFSGYSDMAIGLGRMFGFRFTENFNRPYSAASISDFWRRWHISLSKWFKDYVYIPLGGNRVGQLRHIVNLFVVWALTGLWHGANWTFVLWGLGYFVLLVVEKSIDRSGWPKFIGLLARPYTLVCVALLWVLFRAENLSVCGRYIGGMFGANGNPFYAGVVSAQALEYGAWMAAACLVCSDGFLKLREKFAAGPVKAFLGDIWLVMLFVLSVAAIANSSYSPFIYFNF